MADSDDEDESFIFLGSPLEAYGDDEPRKKLVSVADIQAKDQKGRPRFHGAFTGGFSAGYFNTVGSEQGFIPSTFTSSRKNKSDKTDQNVQKPEDFMDDEDFTEHGIAPRKFVTSGKFSSDERKKKRLETASALTTDSVISGEKALVDLILPDRLTVGVKLLRIMGWKEGQGLGPRQKRRRKKIKPKSGTKMYGCALPESSGDEDNIPEFLEDVKFAPKDVCPIDFQVKDNIHGIGYKGLDPRLALPASSTHINLFASTSTRFPERKGIKGQAFGIGAMEDEDEDIYTVDSMSNYDMTMEKEDENMYGWTAPSSLRGLQQKSIQYTGNVLQGFIVSSVPIKIRQITPLLPIPRDFKLHHKFSGSTKQNSSSSQSQASRLQHNAMTRSLILGEKPVIRQGSSLPNSSANKEKSDSTKRQKRESRFSLENLDNSKHQKKESRFSLPEFRDSSVDLVSSTADTVTRTVNSPFDRSTKFQPFLMDPEKQNRYEKYLTLSQEGRKDAYEQVVLSTGNMTEWEREHEREEFMKAAKLYRPLQGFMACRFTSAKFEDSKTVDVTQEIQVAKNDQTKAAEMKMYGRLTREVLEWHPDRVLCKRFNVPDPYPGSSLLGVPKIKRQSYSIFDMVTFPEQDATTSDPLLQLPASVETSDHDLSEEKTGTDLNKKSQESKSIFSSLFEKKTPETQREEMDQPATSQAVSELLNTGEKVAAVSDDKSIEERPPMDLFEAIFKNTDTEDSSSSSDEQKTEVAPTLKQITEISADTPAQSESAAVENSVEIGSVTSVNSFERAESQWNIETLQSRLKVPDQEDPDKVKNKNSSERKDIRVSSPHRKRKHKHKDKEKQKKKKRKKEKHKKAKHKAKKKKEKKHSHRRHSRPMETDSSSGYDESSDSD